MHVLVFITTNENEELRIILNLKLNEIRNCKTDYLFNELVLTNQRY